MKLVSDEKLLEAYQAGEESAFTQLVKRYEKELFNFLRRFLGKPALAEEAFQETFLQIHLSAQSFETGRKFRPWLYTIAANKARDLLRHQSRRPAMQLTALDDETGPAALWDLLLQDQTAAPDIIEQKEDEQRVREVVATLPDNLREILTLAYFQQLPYKDIAEALSIPLGTVKSRLHAAVAAFAKAYEKATHQRRD